MTEYDHGWGDMDRARAEFTPARPEAPPLLLVIAGAAMVLAAGLAGLLLAFACGAFPAPRWPL